MPRVRNLTVYGIADDASMFVGGDIKILDVSGTYVPFLSCESLLDMFPAVTVDAGAIRFVCNGAHIMRPGIVSYDRFGPGQMVCVKESRGKYLAVGISEMDYEAMDAATRGMAARNVHYISDKYWESAKLLP